VSLAPLMGTGRLVGTGRRLRARHAPSTARRHSPGYQGGARALRHHDRWQKARSRDLDGAYGAGAVLRKREILRLRSLVEGSQLNVSKACLSDGKQDDDVTTGLSV
jgi:hypothetical protein